MLFKNLVQWTLVLERFAQKNYKKQIKKSLDLQKSKKR